MTTLQELIAQREELDRLIAEARTQAREEGLSKIRELMTSHGLNVADLSDSGTSGKGKSGMAGTKVAPKYRDPASGKT